ncbi:hypothetical protein SAMN05216251_114153 [Actinacidiphila alni]|uniref:Uncharacterized protein n=1 Tax=Actinacidiphila alni TaxID=380248 RepID=A0A1I2ISZ8_9ACTN|nr:hypothetical protein [Actinacidiphila alni]SFF44840.1 hypothetical protein SAMN05216251_114153 [Actinacidiphila alni]
MKEKKVLATAASVVAITAGLVLAGGAGPATAQTSTSTVAPSAAPASAMHEVTVERVLDKAPDSSGHVRVQLSNGATISILASHVTSARNFAAKHANVTPDGTVTGNCGSSYIEVNYKSNGEPVHMDTGFTVNHAAVEYDWHAHISGSSGTGYDYAYHASGTLAAHSTWHGQHSSGDNYPSGTYAASVSASGSWALLDTGSICYSGGPYDSAYLTR